MTDDELLKKIEHLRSLMVSVATGGAKIDEVNPKYQPLYTEIDKELQRRGIPNPIPYTELWEWYGRWRSGDMPSYQSRREYLAELFNPLHKHIRTVSAGQAGRLPEPTGWPRVDRTIDEIRSKLPEAKNEEQYQGIGLLCREALISLAQAVYVFDKHGSVDGTLPSNTDAKRMLEAYLKVELQGGPNDETRAHARAAFNLANALQHRRTADFRQAAMCAEATTAVVNIIAIASGRWDL